MIFENITTFHIDELLGTKLRALYQRSKGKDLFDLYYSNANLKPDYEKLLECYNVYMHFVVDKPPSKKKFLANLAEKQLNPDFIGDLEGLLRPEIQYDQDRAFEWMTQLIEKIK